MDVVALVREEWSTLVGMALGVGGAVLAGGRGEWHWVVVCLLLVVACIRILQSEGWILQEPVIAD